MFAHEGRYPADVHIDLCLGVSAIADQSRVVGIAAAYQPPFHGRALIPPDTTYHWTHGYRGAHWPAYNDARVPGGREGIPPYPPYPQRCDGTPLFKFQVSGDDDECFC